MQEFQSPDVKPIQTLTMTTNVKHLMRTTLFATLLFNAGQQSMAQQQTYERNNHLERLSAAADSVIANCTYLNVTDAGAQLEQGINKKIPVKLATPKSAPMDPAQIYANAKKATVIFGSSYKCTRCEKTHVSHSSGYFIDESGIVVTNYHVIDGYINPKGGNKSLSLQIMTADGKVYPVTEVLSASKANDLAIVRIDGGKQKFQTLAIGKNAAEGEKIFVLGHPQSYFYYFSDGMVSHNYQTRASRDTSDHESRYFMAVTADYATGSSGGPVLDIYGNVIGTVSSTNSLYVDNQKQTNLQMVVKNTIPAFALKDLIK